MGSTYNDRVPRTRDECNAFQDNIKPSIGNNGRHCVCVKPNESFDAKSANNLTQRTFNEFKSLRREYREAEKLEMSADPGSVDDLYELYQSDFKEGTYRILKAGTYKIMEDIEFDFNAGDSDDPNSGESWWPREDQSEIYPGAGDTRDVYYLGFIAGITVEVDATLQCVVGRDGSDDSDFISTTVDNEGCYGIDGEAAFEAYQQVMRSKSDAFASSSAKFKIHGMGPFARQLVFALSALVAIIIVGGMVFLWENRVRGAKRPSGSPNSRRRARSRSESQPLIAQHVDALRYL